MTIEDRYALAVKTREEAVKDASRLLVLKNKKHCLKLNYMELMKIPDSQLRMYRGNGDCVGSSLSRIGGGLFGFQEDQALSLLSHVYEQISKDGIEGRVVCGDIQDRAIKYSTQIFKRTMNKETYNSILDGTESFMGKYLEKAIRERDSSD